MTAERAESKRRARLVTEDWLAVAAGLALVALVLTGVLKNIP